MSEFSRELVKYVVDTTERLFLASIAHIIHNESLTLHQRNEDLATLLIQVKEIFF